MSEPAPADPVCQVCGEAIASDMVWCVDCSTPHHRDCFAYNGRCSVFGCTGMRYRQTAGKDRGEVWIDLKDDQGELVPQGYVVEYTSWREGGTRAMGCFFLLLGLFFLMPTRNRSSTGPTWAEGAMICGALCAFFWILWAGLRDYRIIDGKTRKIWLHRQFFAHKSLTPEVEFEQIRSLRLVGRYETQGKSRTPGVAWRLLAHLADGTEQALTDQEFVRWNRGERADPSRGMRSTGDRVARILGRRLEVEVSGLPR